MKERFNSYPIQHKTANNSCINDKQEMEFEGIDVDNYHYCTHLLSVFLPFKNTFYYIL